MSTRADPASGGIERGRRLGVSASDHRERADGSEDESCESSGELRRRKHRSEARSVVRESEALSSSRKRPEASFERQRVAGAEPPGAFEVFAEAVS